MMMLGSGLYGAKHYEDALSVQEAELATLQRVGASETRILIVQGNLACTYLALGRYEEALRVKQEVYSGRLRLDGEEHEKTLLAAYSYAATLKELKRFEEAKALLRDVIPVARRVLGESGELTLVMRWTYAIALYEDNGRTLDDLREAVTTLEDAEPTARRVLGGAHPHTRGIKNELRITRALRARHERAATAQDRLRTTT